MKVNEQHGRGRNDPQQSIAVIGSEYGIRCDTGRIIIRESSEEPGPEDCQKGGKSPRTGAANLGELASDPATMVRDRMGRCMCALAVTTGKSMRVVVDVSNTERSSLAFFLMRAHSREAGCANVYNEARAGSQLIADEVNLR